MNALFVAWRSENSQHCGWGPVGRLEHDGQLFRFCYTRGARRSDFQPFSQMELLDQVYESEALFPLFANRLLPNSRPEYEAYLRWSGFDPNRPPDPIVILGVTEGIRQTDSVEVFPCPVPDSQGCFLNRFFLHGIRWMPSATIERIGSLKQGEALRLMADLHNEADHQAVAVRTEEQRTLVGYVPRYLARDVWKLWQGCGPENFDLTVDRVNRDAPLQNRVLCRLQTCWSAEFQPGSGDDFLPIPQAVPARSN